MNNNQKKKHLVRHFVLIVGFIFTFSVITLSTIGLYSIIPTQTQNTMQMCIGMSWLLVFGMLLIAYVAGYSDD